MAQKLIRNQEVGGSIPPRSTNKIIKLEKDTFSCRDAVKEPIGSGRSEAIPVDSESLELGLERLPGHTESRRRASRARNSPRCFTKRLFDHHLLTRSEVRRQGRALTGL